MAVALDGQVGIHDPSTVVVCDGKYWGEQRDALEARSCGQQAPLAAEEAVDR
jgi:hypothetical protein